MEKKTGGSPRRDNSLSRERIIEASIALLDVGGVSGLTFRTLSERLATGPGAIYWHIANKSDLVGSACDAVVAGTVDLQQAGASADATIRAVALAMFDAMDAHPWIGPVLSWATGQHAMVRILECIGQQVRALGVPHEKQWATVSALLNYILGVGGQNATNGQFARAKGADRSEFLDSVGAAWSGLDPAEYPFVRSVVAQMRTHDDRVDFLEGIDLILRGITAH